MAATNRRVARVTLLIIIKEKPSQQTADNATTEKKAILDTTNFPKETRTRCVQQSHAGTLL